MKHLMVIENAYEPEIQERLTEIFREIAHMTSGQFLKASTMICNPF